ncbi:hypothetical protein JCM10908_006905 [Rhodotorula pacifica]|uniref:uncharacterized protein n=1 Tax=Rhodotorula pacifica TaxID=1495444 RepID=UPI003175ED6D
MASNALTLTPAFTSRPTSSATGAGMPNASLGRLEDDLKTLENQILKRFTRSDASFSSKGRLLLELVALIKEKASAVWRANRQHVLRHDRLSDVGTALTGDLEILHDYLTYYDKSISEAGIHPWILAIIVPLNQAIYQTSDQKADVPSSKLLDGLPQAVTHENSGHILAEFSFAHEAIVRLLAFNIHHAMLQVRIGAADKPDLLKKPVEGLCESLTQELGSATKMEKVNIPVAKADLEHVPGEVRSSVTTYASWLLMLLFTLHNVLVGGAFDKPGQVDIACGKCHQVVVWALAEYSKAVSSSYPWTSASGLFQY